MAKERQHIDQSPPPRAAAPIAPYPVGTPAPTVSSPSPPSMGPCLFSLSAPQVEDYALDAAPIPSTLEQATLMMDKQDGSVPHDARPRTRSIARVERLVIPSSLEISDSEEEDFGQAHAAFFVPKPFGASPSVVATKKVTKTACRRLLTTPSKSSNYSPARGVHTTRSTSARTSTSSSKKKRTTSTYTPISARLHEMGAMTRTATRLASDHRRSTNARRIVVICLPDPSDSDNLNLLYGGGIEPDMGNHWGSPLLRPDLSSRSPEGNDRPATRPEENGLD